MGDSTRQACTLLAKENIVQKDADDKPLWDKNGNISTRELLVTLGCVALLVIALWFFKNFGHMGLT